ncbi:MAG TPA: response regulator [Actinomycetota bacterium]|nr:response regulator [Actinomycetota bacterium]
MRRKLLIADDESGIRRLVRMTLAGEDFEILEAVNGEEALTLARAENPHLLLLDVKMPRRNGLDVCRVLKDDPATQNIPIVILTAQSQDADEAAGRAAGADFYFTKPFSPVALVRKVDEILLAAS